MLHYYNYNVQILTKNDKPLRKRRFVPLSKATMAPTHTKDSSISKISESVDL